MILCQTLGDGFRRSRYLWFPDHPEDRPEGLPRRMVLVSFGTIGRVARAHFADVATVQIRSRFEIEHKKAMN